MIGSRCILKREPNYCGAKGLCDFKEGSETNCSINKALQRISRHSRIKSSEEAVVSGDDLNEAKSRVLGLMDSKVSVEKKKVLTNLAKKLDTEIKKRAR